MLAGLQCVGIDSDFDSIEVNLDRAMDLAPARPAAPPPVADDFDLLDDLMSPQPSKKAPGETLEQMLSDFFDTEAAAYEELFEAVKKDMHAVDPSWFGDRWDRNSGMPPMGVLALVGWS